jgi:exopolysaccharide biosynthesis polyprenyl glycosylphosphotransferase
MSYESPVAETGLAPHGPQAWMRKFARRLMVTDATIVIAVVLLVTRLRFHTLNPFSPYTAGDVRVQYWVISFSIISIWLIALVFDGSRDNKVLGSGPAEYQRVLWSSAAAFLGVLMFAFFTQTELARTYVAGIFALGTLTLLVSRWLWRSWLSRQRRSGKYASHVVLAGSLESVRIVAEELARHPEAGYWVLGACLSKRDQALLDSTNITLAKTTIPVLGTPQRALESMDLVGADTLVITSADDLPPKRVRELSWGLEPGRQHLVVAPSLLDVGGPRIHTRPVAGVPLMHIETPTLSLIDRSVKRTFDIVGSALILVVLSPLFLAVAIAVATTSPGPVFYKQQRIGRLGGAFHMYKFRSMVVDADNKLAELLKAQGTEGTPLFKVRNDPRLTPIGPFIRKYSIDELPQLVNVFLGSMSLIGPRPQREAEVALYDEAAKRRLIAKPGMTGLWQVSGRSALSWEESIRLDLYYVENWTLTGDLMIMWRTAKAVLIPGESAY